MITLLSPIWLVLAIPLAVAMWVWRMPTRLLSVMRAVVIVLLLLGLSGLAVELPSRAGIVVVVADRSYSMPEGADAAHREAVERIQAEMGPRDRLAVVAFGERPAVDHAPQAGTFGGFLADIGPDASNIHDALDRALALIDSGIPARIVLVSDGRWTGRDPMAPAARAAARGIPVDYRLLERPVTGDLAIESLDAPPSVAPREGFLLTAWVRSPAAQQIEYTLRRGNSRIAAGTRQVPAGVSRLTFRDRLEEPATASYTLSVSGERPDPVPENNRARVLVGVEGPRPILLASERPDPGLGRLLAAGGLEVRHVHPAEADWSLESLSGYAAVILEEVPAAEIGPLGMETLAQWVRQTGSGLMMTGGRRSFGPGGYFQSPLDPILPVSMELRQEHRKHATAMVLVIDRSGSMSGQPLALAREASMRAIDMLTPVDEAGVITFDTRAHVVSGLQPISDPDAIKHQIARIQSGGGTYMYAGMVAARDMLRQAAAVNRHMIVLGDGLTPDADHLGLVDELRAMNTTVSTVALGAGADRELLSAIAERGGGRYYETMDPTELPELFARDIEVVARSTFIAEDTAVAAAPAMGALLGWSPERVPAVGGYSLTYLRDGAQLAMRTADEYRAPVLAAWHAGAGRVLAYTAQAEGDFTGPIAQWDEVGDLFTAMARWTAGEIADLPDGMLLTQQLHEGVNLVELHLDPDRANPGLAELPGAAILRGEPGRTPTVDRAAMRWTSPDTLAVEIPLTGTETSITTVEVPGLGPVALPPVTLPYSPEFQPVPPERGGPTLRRMAGATGGLERVSLGGVWADLPRRPRLMDLSPWLLLAAAFALLVEVLERRTGALSLALHRLRRNRRAGAAPESEAETAPATGRPTRSAGKPTAPAPIKPTPGGAPEKPAATAAPHQPSPVATPASGGVLDALGQARRRASDRTRR